MTAPATLDALFRAAADAHPDRPAVSGGGTTWTFAELSAEAGRIATYLTERGIRRGDRILVAMENAPACAAIHVATARLGAAIVPVNLALAPEDAAFVLGAAEARLAFVSGAAAAVVERLREAVPEIPETIAVERRPWGSARPLEAGPYVDPEDVAAVYFTSGTTGRPKGAALPHRAVAADVAGCVEAFDLAAGRRYTVPIPLFHSFAATVGLWIPLTTGGTSILLPRPDPDALLAAIRAGGAGIVIGVPDLFAEAARRAATGAAGAAPGLDFFVAGGAALPAPARKALAAAFGVPVYEGYGTTECGPVVATERPGGAGAPGTVGPPIPGVRVEVRDEEGTPCRTGEVGEIVVHGPNLFLGYLDHADATARAMRGGWFHTGDLGFMDEAGDIRIVDRRGDVVRWRGIAVFPHEVEEVLAAHPAVREAAVVGASDDEGGEAPIAFVIPAGDPPPAADLIAFCRDRLAIYKVPRSVEYRTSLPRTANGKVLKRALRQKWM